MLTSLSLLIPEATTLNTIIAILVGLAIVYFLVLGQNKVKEVSNTRDRGIKKENVTTEEKVKKPIFTETATATVTTIKDEIVVMPKVSQKIEPSLARYEASTAITSLIAYNYIRREFPIKKVSGKTFLEELIAEATVLSAIKSDTAPAKVEGLKPASMSNEEQPVVAKTTQDKLGKENLVDSAAPIIGTVATTAAIFTETLLPATLQEEKKIAVEPYLAAYNATVASTALEAQKYISALPKPPRPSLAAYNATVASTVLEAQEYIAALPKPPRPFLAAYNATVASTALEAQKYIAALPKPPRPSLAAYNATVASTVLEAQKYIAALPKPPRPSLAAYNATVASAAIEAQKYIAALPKPPRPSLAAYNATVAFTALEAQEYVANLPKAPKPFLAAFESTTALYTLKAQEYVALLPKPPMPFLAAFEATTAITHFEAQEYIKSRPKISVNEELSMSSKTRDISTCTASERATPVSEIYQKEVEAKKEDSLDSDVEVEIEGDLSSLVTTPSTSISSLHSSESNSMNSTRKITANASSFVPNYEYSATWTKIINEGLMTTEPRNFDSQVMPNNGQKRLWTREEKMEKQIQSHMPKMKNRCDYWPSCTNKHCKFSHPVIPCRIGDGCPFGKRCSFIHPSDYIEPPKRRNTASNAGNRKKSTRTPNNRSNTMPSKVVDDTLKI